MKKTALVLIIGMLAAGAAFADYPEHPDIDDRIGLGGGLNIGGGSHGFLIGPKLSLDLPNVPFLFGVAINFNVMNGLYSWGPSFTADHHFFSGNVRNEVLTDDAGYTYHLMIDWYAGLGIFANPLFGGPGNVGFANGIRLPMGVLWNASRQIDVNVSVVPSFGWYFGHGRPDIFWSVGAEIVGRYRFTPRSRRQDRNGEPAPEPPGAVEPLDHENGGNGSNGEAQDVDGEHS